MVFGQKEFDRVWKIGFYDIPRLVNPVATLGALVAVLLGVENRKREIRHGQWGLIWAIGICTAVWRHFQLIEGKSAVDELEDSLMVNEKI